MRKLILYIKWILALLLLAIVAIFSFQNAEIVEIQFLSWTVETRRAGVVAFSMICGILIGWMFGATVRR